MGFKPIQLREYIELHLRADPEVERAELIQRLGIRHCSRSSRSTLVGHARLIVGQSEGFFGSTPEQWRSSISTVATRERLDILLPRAQEFQEIEPLVLAGLGHAQ